MDIYASFEQLRQREGDDAFEIALMDRQSPISIIAPHGGNIEPGTTELAQLIAGNLYNFYSFTACKPQDSPDLHITSHNFDEPQCLALLSRSQRVITVHGFKSDHPMIYLGGRDTRLKQAIFQTLHETGLPVADDHPKYQGVRPENICNRSQTGMGVQLEFSRHFRGCEQYRATIAFAVQSALQWHIASLVTDEPSTI
jgi:phage replication-related protein YjqB (UPF0714/DUF867 family)